MQNLNSKPAFKLHQKNLNKLITRTIRSNLTKCRLILNNNKNNKRRIKKRRKNKVVRISQVCLSLKIIKSHRMHPLARMTLKMLKTNKKARIVCKNNLDLKVNLNNFQK